jgi:hypothetical protein
MEQAAGDGHPWTFFDAVQVEMSATIAAGEVQPLHRDYISLYLRGECSR